MRRGSQKEWIDISDACKESSPMNGFVDPALDALTLILFVHGSRLLWYAMDKWCEGARPLARPRGGEGERRRGGNLGRVKES